jgi:hypothetical protein
LNNIQDYIIIKNLLKKNINLMKSLSFFTQRHAFHLVDPSVMPLLTSIAAFTLLLGGSMYFHGYIMGLETSIFGFFSVIACMFF